MGESYGVISPGKENSNLHKGHPPDIANLTHQRLHFKLKKRLLAIVIACCSKPMLWFGCIAIKFERKYKSTHSYILKLIFSFSKFHVLSSTNSVSNWLIPLVKFDSCCWKATTPCRVERSSVWNLRKSSLVIVPEFFLE